MMTDQEGSTAPTTTTTTVLLREATEVDVTSIVDLFRSASSGDPIHGIAYPRWDSEAEVFSELDAYGATLSKSVYLLRGGTAGITGLLGGPEDDHAYVIGPILREPRDDVHYANILVALEPLAKERNLAVLRTCVPADADVRLRALKMRGYACKSTAVEMVMKGAEVERPTAKTLANVRIEPLTPSSPTEWFTSLVGLLRDKLECDGSASDVERLRGYLIPPYRVSVAFAAAASDREPVGVVITWADTDFARVEYLAVSPAARKRGIGEALMNDAIHHLRESHGKTATPLDIFLQVDEWRTPAIRLYERIGFTQSQVSMIFEKPLRDSPRDR